MYVDCEEKITFDALYALQIRKKYLKRIEMQIIKLIPTKQKLK